MLIFIRLYLYTYDERQNSLWIRLLVLYPIHEDRPTMNAQQTALKNQLLEACYVKQQALINDFKIRIKALLQVDGLGNEEEYDNNQQANVSQNITKLTP